MGEKTGIEWTHHTWSPWWGCTKVSDGCKHCYAQRESSRWGWNIWGPSANRRMLSESHWHKPLVWNDAAKAAGERRCVFPSMCDPFEKREDLVEPRKRMFDLIDKTPWLDWLLCTKRPENILPMWATWPIHWNPNKTCRRTNVWLLASVEDQATADKRIPELLRCRELVPVLGLSLEPLLSDVLFNEVPIPCEHEGAYTEPDTNALVCRKCEDANGLESIDWVIVGGESGPSARPMHPAWVRSIRDQCQAAGVPFFFKQWGEWLGELQDGTNADGTTHCNCSGAPERIGKKLAGSMLDGRTWKELPEVHQ